MSDDVSPITVLAKSFIFLLADDSDNVFIASNIFPVGGESLYRFSISIVMASELSFLSLYIKSSSISDSVL